MERSILLLSDCALLPYCPVILIIYILGCAFFVLPIAHTRVLLRTAVCFLTWIFNHMWIPSHTWMLFHVFSQSSVRFQSDNYPHLIPRLCHCLLLGSLIPLLMSPSGVHWHCCGTGQWHWPPEGFESTLLLCQAMQTLSTYLVIQLSILWGQPQAPIKMVTLTIYCLKDNLGVLCASGNYPQAAEGL